MTDSWQARTPGTWQLYQFVNPGHNGQTETIGEFPSFRAATEAARRIAKISNLRGDFSTSFCRSNKRDGAFVDGTSRTVSLDPPEYDPHIEVTLSTGRTVWLEDLERELEELQNHFIATEIA